MKNRVLPVSVGAAVMSAFCLHLAWSAAAQNAVPTTPVVNAPVAAVEAVPLSSGAEDILKLTRAKINDQIIIAFIQGGNRRYDLTASEIIYLRKEGLSDSVLAVMLNPAQPVAETQVAVQPSASVTDPDATVSTGSAPQEYVTTSYLPTTTLVETEPISALDLVPTTTTYYTVYDPWPWYAPWPYWYPYYSAGIYWGWGGCYYGHGGYCHDGYHPPHSGYHPPPNGNPPPPNGNPPPGGSPSGTVAGGRHNSGKSGSVTAGGLQANGGATRGGQTTTPTSTWTGASNNRGTAQPNGNAVGVRLGQGHQSGAMQKGGSPATVTTARNTKSASPTTTWTGRTSRTTPTTSTRSVGAAPVSRSAPVVTSPTVVSRSPSSPPVTRHVGGGGLSSQRAGSSSGFSMGSGGGASGFSRPSGGTPSVGGGASSFRSGGGFSGGSSGGSGGGFRGGGGGGGHR